MSLLVRDLGFVPYEAAHQLQRSIVKRLQEGGGNEALYLLEHPHVITLGRNASSSGAVIAGAAHARSAQGVNLVTPTVGATSPTTARGSWSATRSSNCA